MQLQFEDKRSNLNNPIIKLADHISLNAQTYQVSATFSYN